MFKQAYFLYWRTFETLFFLSLYETLYIKTNCYSFTQFIHYNRSVFFTNIVFYDPPVQTVKSNPWEPSTFILSSFSPFWTFMLKINIRLRLLMHLYNSFLYLSQFSDKNNIKFSRLRKCSNSRIVKLDLSIIYLRVFDSISGALPFHLSSVIIFFHAMHCLVNFFFFWSRGSNTELFPTWLLRSKIIKLFRTLQPQTIYLFFPLFLLLKMYSINASKNI